MNAVGGEVVREGRPTDLAAVAAIEREAFADPWPAPLLRQELHADRRRRPLVAEAAGAVAGYLMAWVVVDEYHIVNLAVAVAHRRRGVAGRLLDAGLAEARQRGCRTATLEVRVSNAAARAFYDRRGFRRAGLRSRYYADNGEDALILSLDLGPADDGAAAPG